MKHLIAYTLGGVLTTAVNYLFYFSLSAASLNYLAANTAAWAAAVLFSYWVNRRFVFHSKSEWLTELLPFCSMRFFTLLGENILLFSAAAVLLLPPGISKLGVSTATVVLNYVICRKKIFTKGVHNL